MPQLCCRGGGGGVMWVMCVMEEGGGGVMEERGAVDCAVCGYVGVRKRERLSVFEREKVCV